MPRLTRNLEMAKAAKNDEFYTQLTDIEKELRHYRGHFEGKVVFCNCDDPEWSNFYYFFHEKFHSYGLKQLITTHYHRENRTYKLVYDGRRQRQTALKGNGDFRSPECVKLLQKADIVVTNPPFSLFREYVAQLMARRKKFLIIGNINAVPHKEIRPYFHSGKIWLGHGPRGKDPEFRVPEDYPLTKSTRFRVDAKGVRWMSMGTIVWFTNLDHKRRNEELTLVKKYNAADYPEYGNYNAIEVRKFPEIPKDYYGEMGVPVTFLKKHNPKQFDIIGFDRDLPKTDNGKLNDRFRVNGKEKFARVVIKRK